MRVFITILLLSLANVISATNYYVKNGGSDVANGLADGTAWATINKVNTTIAPGDSVFFKRGDTWREQLIPISGTLGDHTYYGAYGTGVKPLILGSVEKNEESDWTNVSGNIWTTATGTFTVDVGNLIFNGEDTCGVKIMSATPTLDAQGEFWYDFTNDLVRIYSVGNPAVFYRDIECALMRNLIHHTNKDYVTYQNLDVRYSGRHGIGTSTGSSYVNVYDCDFSYIGGGDDGVYETRLGNGVEFWAASNNCYVERCTFDNIYDAAISPQGDVGTYEVYNLYFRNNIISRSEYSYELFWHDASASAHNIYFENNTCVNAGGGWSHFQRPDGARGCHVRIGHVLSSATDVMIRNNIFYEATERIIYYHNAAELAKITLNYNCYYQSGGKSYAWRTDETPTNYYTLEAWQAISGQELYAIDDNPLITQTNYSEFAYFSDIHVDYSSWESGELDDFVSGINSKNVNFTVSLGDNIDVAAQVNVDLYNSTMAALDSTLYTGRGNHDASWFTQHFVVDFDNTRLIFFYASYYALPTPPAYNNTGHVTTAELAWIADQLESADGRKCILMGHYPLEESLWGHIIDGHGRAELIDLINTYGVKLYLSGHVHGNNASYLISDYAININSAAASGQTFMVCRVYNDRITITPYRGFSPYTSTTPITTIRFGNDYHIAHNSPVIGAGLDIALATDFDGVSRGDFPSIGAYEYSASYPTPDPEPSGDGVFSKSRLGIQLKDKNGKLIIIQ